MTGRAVLLDAGGTLITERRSRDALYLDVLRPLGARVDEARLARLRRGIERRMLAEASLAYTEDWFREHVARLLRALDLDADPETVRARIALAFARPGTYRVFDDVEPTLEALRARGVRLAVVSNWSDLLPGLLEGLGLARFLDAVAVSALEGTTKPDPRLFERALARLGVPARAALHVGDHPVRDVQGARAAGVPALLLDRSGATPAGPDVLHDLTPLPSRLGA